MGVGGGNWVIEFHKGYPMWQEEEVTGHHAYPERLWGAESINSRKKGGSTKDMLKVDAKLE